MVHYILPLYINKSKYKKKLNQKIDIIYMENHK